VARLAGAGGGWRASAAASVGDAAALASPSILGHDAGAGGAAFLVVWRAVPLAFASQSGSSYHRTVATWKVAYGGIAA